MAEAATSPPDVRMLAEAIAARLDERMATAQGICRLTLQFTDGYLVWVRAEVQLRVNDLERLERAVAPADQAAD